MLLGSQRKVGHKLAIKTAEKMTRIRDLVSRAMGEVNRVMGEGSRDMSRSGSGSPLKRRSEESS